MKGPSPARRHDPEYWSLWELFATQPATVLSRLFRHWLAGCHPDLPSFTPEREAFLQMEDEAETVEDVFGIIVAAAKRVQQITDEYNYRAEELTRELARLQAYREAQAVRGESHEHD